MRKLLGTIACVTLASAGAAAAAGLAVGTYDIGAGAAAVGRCAVAGVVVTPAYSGSSVASARVDGLETSCEGRSVQVTLHNGTTTSNGSFVVPAGGGSATVSLSPQIAIATAHRFDLVIR